MITFYLNDKALKDNPDYNIFTSYTYSQMLYDEYFTSVDFDRSVDGLNVELLLHYIWYISGDIGDHGKSAHLGSTEDDRTSWISEIIGKIIRGR